MAVFSIAVSLFCKPVRVYFFGVSTSVLWFSESLFSALMRVCFVYQLRVHFACWCVLFQTVFYVSVCIVNRCFVYQ